MGENCKKILTKYIIALVFAGAVIWFVLSNRGFFETDDSVLKMMYLADAFTIPGIVMLMVGVMAWMSSKYGLFDGLTYSLGRLAKSLVPGRNFSDERYYDYKEKKIASRKNGYVFLFIIGGGLTLIAVIFTIIHSAMSA